MGLELQRGRRLRARAEFDRVFRKGRRLPGRQFVLIALQNGKTEHRLGIAAGRKLGGAVVRNRARRLLRESFRRMAPVAGPGFDVVLVARADIVGRTQSEVDREFSERVRRLDLDGPRGSSASSPH
jgi:ribonuclease P protein component